MSNLEPLINELYREGIFQNLDTPITLKSGKETKFYADFRKLYTKPKLFNVIADCLAQYIPTETDYIAGSPLGAIPLTTIISQKLNIPFLLVRPQAKEHGTKRLVEGDLHKPDATITIIEDVITTGKSTMETYDKLRVSYPKAKINTVVAILYRGESNIKIHMRTLFNMSQLSKTFSDNMKIRTVKSCNEDDLKMFKYYDKTSPSLSTNKVATIHTTKLLKSLKRKKSNIIFSADLTTTTELISILKQVAPYIVAVKLHTDTLKDIPTEKFIRELKEISQFHNLLIIEDRKFTDIGSTLEKQLTSQVNIASWADAVTVFPCVTKTGIQIINNHRISPIIIEQLSTYKKRNDNPYLSSYERDNTQEHYSFSSSRLINDLSIKQFHLGTIGQKNTLHWQFTPGISLSSKGDNLNQNYATPEQAVKNGADFFIIGRAIYQTENPAETAKHYKLECWKAKLNSL